MSSTDSSDDEGDFYTNAASRLNALKRRTKVHPDVNLRYDDDDDEDDNQDIVKESPTLPKEPKLSAKTNKNNKKNSSENVIVKKNSSDSNVIVLEESSTEPELVEDGTVTEVPDDNVVMYIDSSEEESNVRRSKRRGTRNSSKRGKNNLSRRKAGGDSDKKIIAIPDRLEVEKNSFEDSIERELNKSFNDSFLDLSQDEKEGDYLIIGSPPPAKKCDNDNYEVSIKILWRSNKIERFELRRHETFQKVFRHFSEVEKVPEDQIVITKESKRITPYETPASINWSIVDILEGGIVSAAIAKMNKGQPAQNGVQENVCKIKIQTSDKRTLTVALKHDEAFTTLLNRCVEEFDIPESKIKFYFDGELIDTDETPESLDLDDEACIDLKISK